MNDRRFRPARSPAPAQSGRAGPVRAASRRPSRALWVGAIALLGIGGALGAFRTAGISGDVAAQEIAGPVPPAAPPPAYSRGAVPLAGLEPPPGPPHDDVDSTLTVAFVLPAIVGGIALGALGVWLLLVRRRRDLQLAAFGVNGPALGAPPDDAELPIARAVASVQLNDVAGCDEAKQELVDAIEFLRRPAKFHRLGARVPRGVLLYGPPGTGKTMLARAIATEAGVPFLSVSGSEFVEKYVGVGARRVRDLFAEARRLGRVVVFIDELDAIGRLRSGQAAHEEREQTLNQLLVEMDGFATSDDLVVVAATNRVDVLDPALLRPGRFTRKVHVGLPDVKGRREILAVHATSKPIAMTVDLDGLARRTYGFSGAQLAETLNEAAILAARRGADAISPDDLHEGWLKLAVGVGRRRSMDERERSIIAAHEVGHAVCGRLHGDRRRIEEISLFAHGEALGMTVTSEEDNDLPAESDLRARLVVLLGGRAAEEILFDEVTGAAASDFDQANRLAGRMVLEWGMGRDPDSGPDEGSSGRGALSFLVARPGDLLPPDVQAASTRAIRALLEEAHAAACVTIRDNLPTLRRVAAHLVEFERLDGETFESLVEGGMAAEGRAAKVPDTRRGARTWADAFAPVSPTPYVIGLASTGASPEVDSGDH